MLAAHSRFCTAHFIAQSLRYAFLVEQTHGRLAAACHFFDFTARTNA
jgi:hypothetical protein